MFRHSLAFAALILVGCAANNKHEKNEDGSSDANAKMSAEKPTDTELAAYAGHATYPNTQPSNDLRAAVIVSPDRKSLKIYNFSGQALRNLDVWVNGAYVQHISGIGAQGSVIVRTTELYNNLGKNFSSQSEPVSRVQIKTDQGFYNLMGPVAE